MKDQTRVRWGRLLAGTSAAVGLISMAILAIGGGWELLIEAFILHNGILAVGFGSLALVTMTTQARNGAVWSLAWGAFFAALFTASFAVSRLIAPAAIRELKPGELAALTPSSLPVPVAIALQPAVWAWIPAVLLVLTLGLLLFPDGRPPSPRWRWVAWYSVATIALSVASFAWLGRPSSTHPIGDPVGSAGTVGQIASALILVTMVGVVLSAAALVVRYRRSSGVTRHQIRWIVWGGTFLAATLVLSFFVEGGPTGSGSSVPGYVALVAEALLILSFAFAITKYRLYDVDVVISRTVVYGSLAVFITGVYVAVVVGLGSLLGQGDEPNLALAIGATAVVAFLFEPVRLRVQAWANRLVYGERATPYEVLSQLTVRLADTETSEQALSRLAALIAKGTGAEQSVVWLRVGDRLRPEAIAPAGSSLDASPLHLIGTGLPDLPGDASVAVRHSDEVLGALTITKHRADAVTPADQRLLEDVAAGAALMLRNLRLNVELEERAEEVRASRRRLIAAHDAERHRLERDLHDGAQQQVVALKVKLGLARAIADKEGADELASAVSGLADDTQNAVDQMRVLAHGIYPPLLEAEGLAAALTAARRSMAIPVELQIDNIARYSRQVEETVYFYVTEMIGDAVMAGAKGAGVAIHGGDEGLAITISYDAIAGSLDRTTLADRIDAADGTVDDESSSDATKVTVQLPAQIMEPA